MPPPPPASFITHLDTPFPSPTNLLQIRTSKMLPMHNLTIQTGIYKKPRTTRVSCSFTGLDADEHDLTFHGGVDKAVHQYYPGHYEFWKGEFVDQAGGFEVGGFGENLVVEGNMNERNVCIGDVIRIGRARARAPGEVDGGGDGVLLQVCLPRQPCFKLNHRFGIKGFAELTWKRSRTGWYYRVLEEGFMEVGDEVRLVERRWPAWTIERVQEFVNRNTGDRHMLEELASIEAFGGEARERVARLLAKLDRLEKNSAGEKVKEVWEEWAVVEKTVQTKRISSFVIQKDGEGEAIDPGCFVRLKLPDGLIRPYSIVSGTTHKIELGIALAENGRGGSRYLHDSIHVGSKILVGKITPGVPMKSDASNHIFIAGGIGITAFLSHLDMYEEINLNYVLHYAVRDGADIPFKERLGRLGGKVRVYDKANGERMDIEGILRARTWNSFIYVCGSQRMIDDVVRSSNICGMAQDEIHYEAFQVDAGGDPFVVEVLGRERGSGKGDSDMEKIGGKIGEKEKEKENLVLEVPGDKSLLEVLRDAGLEIESSCETGNCGTCRVRVCEGRVEHRGSALSEGEKEEGEMLSCVSRGVGRIVIDF